MTIQHQDLADTPFQHAPWRWIVASIAERDALTVTVTDVYQTVFVTEDKAAYVLTGHDPVEWTALGAA